MSAPSRLYASAETAGAIEAAGQVVFLVGGYDGSGNIGDILQLRAALELVGAASRAARVPVLELGQAESHAGLTARAPGTFPCEGVVFLDGFEGGGSRDDLALWALELPRETAVLTYLYGGGYLNRLWGARKLAMLRAVEASGRAPGRIPPIVSSGLQLSPTLSADIGIDAVELLDRLVTVGVRDPASREVALSLLSGSPADEVVLTGDDAVGAFRRRKPVEGTPSGTGVTVLVHVTGESYATSDPEHRVQWVAAVVAALDGALRGGLRPVPVVAYDDRVRSERGAAARLSEALVAGGVECGDPIVLVNDPAASGDLVAATGARLAISSSYHVGLIALLLGIPAALVVENDYYRQKAAGLVEGFELPGELLLDPFGDPAAAAAALLPLVSGGSGSERVETLLVRGRERLVRRRLDAEEILHARLARLELDLIGSPVDGEERRPAAGSLAELLDERTDLLVRQFDEVAALHGERDRLRHDLDAVAADVERLRRELSEQVARAELAEDQVVELQAELEASRAEAERLRRWLDVVHASSSWRLTAPLRAARRLGRSSGREQW